MLPRASENAGNYRPVNQGKQQREGGTNNEKVVDANSVVDSMNQTTLKYKGQKTDSEKNDVGKKLK
jgi:hypothetical protein